MSCWREVTGGRGKGAGLFGCYTINAFVTVRAGENWERGNGIWEIDCGLRSYTILGPRGQATVSRRGKARDWRAYDGNVKTITDDDHQ